MKFMGKYDVEMRATLWKKIDIFKNASQCQSGVSIVGTVMNKEIKRERMLLRLWGVEIAWLTVKRKRDGHVNRLTAPTSLHFTLCYTRYKPVQIF